MISLVMTVLNEHEVLPRWFKNIALQTKQPDEIIIVDGGSSDETWEYLLEMSKKMLSLKVYREPGNIAHGRNFAIRKSTGNLMVVTNAGCIYSPNWLEKLTEPFADKHVSWSATGFGPWFEQEDKVISYLIASATIPDKNEFQRNWLPSSRSVAFLKDRWQTAGGYPEWVSYFEDELLDKKLFRKEGWPYFIREPMVFWRPRTKISSYVQMMFDRSRSEGKGMLNFHKHIMQYLGYLAFVYFAWLSAVSSAAYLLPIVALILFYFDRYWKRWAVFAEEKNSVYSFFGMLALPFVVAVGDGAKMIGYLLGLIERSIKIREVEYY
jgi:glycosyltransferase involved in cell wall biosynthesis